MYGIAKRKSQIVIRGIFTIGAYYHCHEKCTPIIIVKYFSSSVMHVLNKIKSITKIKRLKIMPVSSTETKHILGNILKKYIAELQQCKHYSKRLLVNIKD